jgi:hypothetical protein
MDNPATRTCWPHWLDSEGGFIECPKQLRGNAPEAGWLRLPYYCDRSTMGHFPKQNDGMVITINVRRDN